MADVADLAENLAVQAVWTPATLVEYENRRDIRLARARACALVVSGATASWPPPDAFGGGQLTEALASRAVIAPPVTASA